MQRIREKNEMIDKRTWTEFRKSGLLWWINMILHTFGWAIVTEIDKQTGEVQKTYPARVKFRGFSEKCNTDGYICVSEYMGREAEKLLKESKE